jgi:hypothetical protein
MASPFLFKNGTFQQNKDHKVTFKKKFVSLDYRVKP